MTFLVRFYVKIKTNIKEHISQQELADKSIGITKHLIGTLERGEANPTLDKMILLEKFLNQEKVVLFGVEIDVNKFYKEWKKDQSSKLSNNLEHCNNLRKPNI